VHEAKPRNNHGGGGGRINPTYLYSILHAREYGEEDSEWIEIIKPCALFTIEKLKSILWSTHVCAAHVDVRNNIYGCACNRLCRNLTFRLKSFTNTESQNMSIRSEKILELVVVTFPPS